MEPGSVEEWRAITTSFIRTHVERSGAKGVVVGISGGIDSAVTAALAVAALGQERVHGILLPHEASDPLDQALGEQLVARLGIGHDVRDITAASNGILASVGEGEHEGNVKARIRMTMLYAEAQKRNCLVCGTGNKSELLVGYFTKWGDGGVDLEPIGDLWKTQVWDLAKALGIPTAIIERPPTAGLVPGQTDEDELGMDYHTLDRVLKCIELNAGLDEVIRRTGVTEEQARRVELLVRRSEHKRHMPIVPKIGARTVGIDWRRSVHWDA